MRIAVFNCPSGMTAEALVRAFLDAGLPRSYLAGKLASAQSVKRAKERAQRILKALHRAKLQGSEKDSLTQITRVAQGIEYFQIQKCFVRNLAIGRKGNPRTLKLLRGFTLERVPVNQELVTPEGAALLTALCEKESSIPCMRLESVGFGPDRFMVSIGETVAPYRRERILLLETNIDDMSPQGFELLYERLFKTGALDVWVQPILMKKTRPAFKLSALFRHPDLEKIAEVVFKETSTLGVRFLELDRFSLPRKWARVKTRFGRVRVKVGSLDSEYFAIHPEYEDLKRISQKRNLPFRQIYEGVLRELKGEKGQAPFGNR